MSLVPERANAVNVFHITLSLRSCPPVPFPLKWKRPMTVLFTGSLKCSKLKVAEKASLGYIIE